MLIWPVLRKESAMNKNICLLIMLPILCAACSKNDSRVGVLNPPPITVTETLHAVDFQAGVPTRVMRLRIEKSADVFLTLDKVECVLNTTSLRPGNLPPIRADFTMAWKEHSTDFPMTLGVDGSPFGLFFAGEKMQQAKFLEVDIYATITGCQPGESLIFAEQAIGVRGYDNENGYRSVWLTCVASAPAAAPVRVWQIDEDVDLFQPNDPCTLMVLRVENMSHDTVELESLSCAVISNDNALNGEVVLLSPDIKGFEHVRRPFKNEVPATLEFNTSTTAGYDRDRVLHARESMRLVIAVDRTNSGSNDAIMLRLNNIRTDKGDYQAVHNGPSVTRG